MATLSLPFAHLNLRRNPFGELTTTELRDLSCMPTDDLTTFLCRVSPTHRPPALQILGDKGFGKTTHLLRLQALFPDASYTWLPPDDSVPLDVSGDPILVDEAQRLTWKQRRHLFRIPRRLVLATHQDFERLLRHTGRDVLTISADRATSPKQIETILNARIEQFRRSDGPIPVITQELAIRLHQRYGSCIRAILHALYREFQHTRSIDDVRSL